MHHGVDIVRDFIPSGANWLKSTMGNKRGTLSQLERWIALCTQAFVRTKVCQVIPP